MNVADYVTALTRLYAAAGKSLSLAPPSVRSLVALEEQLPAPLPQGLREAWMHADGGAEYEPVFARPGYLTGYDFLSVSGARREREAMRKRAPKYEGHVEMVTRDARILPGWFAPGWLPFASFGGGSLRLLVDLSPAPEGTVGQIIAFTHDPDEIELVAPSFEQFLSESLAYLTKEADEILCQ